MKTELRRPKTLLGIFLALTLAFSLTMTAPVMAQVTFTGNVETDFPASDPLVFIVADPDGRNVFVPAHPVTNTSSGWDIKDVRLKYDSVNDILYVGLNSYQTVGDADTDGNEGEMHYASGVDVPNIGPGESVSVYFDLNQDGQWDVIAGVPPDADFSDFTIMSANGTVPGPAFYGTASLTTHLGTRYWTGLPLAPDLEFEIRNFSGLPNQGGALGAFTIGAYMGSLPDENVGEDIMWGYVNLFTPPPPVGGTALPVDKLHLLAPWATLVGCAAIITLLILRKRHPA